MHTHLATHRHTVRTTLATALVAAAALAAPALGAQDSPTDGRWLAFVGCWQPTGADASSRTGPKRADESSRLVCVIPTASRAAAEVVTVADGRIVERQRVEATGRRRASDRDGCTGWESAEWAADGGRVYLSADYRCDGGLAMRTSGLMTLTSDSTWVTVSRVESGSGSGVRVRRYRAIPDTVALPTEVANALEGRALPTTAARLAASAALTVGDVIDASRRVHGAVVEAWLVERGQGFGVDAAQLLRLARAEVPAKVIDVMVALSYPEAFAIGRQTMMAERRAIPERVVGYGVYDPYGYGYGYGYSDYGYYAGSPVVVVVRPPGGGGGRTHGQVVQGQGYTQGGSDDRRADSSPSSRGAGSGGSRSDTEKSSGGSSHDSGRTAKPRP